MSEITTHVHVKLITDYIHVKDNLYSLKNDKNERILKTSDEISNKFEIENSIQFSFKYIKNEKWYKITFSVNDLNIPSNIFILTINFRIEDILENIKIPVELSNKILTLPGLKCEVKMKTIDRIEYIIIQKNKNKILDIDFEIIFYFWLIFGLGLGVFIEIIF